MRPVWAVPSAVVALLLPAASEAGTVAVNDSGEASYRAAPAETNSLLVSVSRVASDGFRVTVTDSGAPVVAGAGCLQAGDLTAVCDISIGDIRVDLRDGDDSVDLTAARQSYSSVSGGEGRDRITVTGGGATIYGGPGDDLLVGGDRADTLYGGGGRDALRGGRGSNRLVDGDRKGDVDADVLDGGGRGCIDYGARSQPMRVDLARGRAGERGEGDRVSGFTAVATGRGADVLVGTAADERFNGGGGADRIFARGGDDRIAASGRGAVVGGPGTDRVDYFYFDLCGPAVIDHSRRGAWLADSCELLVMSSPSKCGAVPRVRPQPVSASQAGALKFRMRFDSTGVIPQPCAPPSLCYARLTITTPRRPFVPLASKRFRERLLGGTVSVNLPNAIVARAQARGVQLRAQLDWMDDCEGRYSAAWRFVVRLPD